jgi:8-oxo-dGTP pyrophosphatase MutT (NUDIX family)
MVYLTDPEGRILVVRARGLLAEHWMPPGGHIDPHESPAQAACRELSEEIAVQCEPGDLAMLGQVGKDIGTGTLTLFAAQRHQGSVVLGAEILEARWVNPAACTNLPILPATAYGLRLFAAWQRS